MSGLATSELWTDRSVECRRLREAFRARKRLLVWGPPESGKTELVRRVLEGLPEADRCRCLYFTGTTIPGEFLRETLRQLYERREKTLLATLASDAIENGEWERWLKNQSSLRLRTILYRALRSQNFWLILDHLPPLSPAFARLLKEIIWRCRTPVYLLARGCTRQILGSAWSLYWTDGFRIGLGPLPERSARKLLELCICRFGLTSLNLEGFREQVLRLSGNMPGSIVKMCQLASQPRYHHGDQIKVKLLHVDYLMRANLSGIGLRSN